MIAIIIPSRLNSVRLPKKPLADINGKPMIQRVVDCALKANIADVFVASDSDEILNVVEGCGKIMTPSELQTGTDRVHFASQTLPKKYSHIINLQGDLPFVDAKILEKLANNLLDDGITTIASTVEDDVIAKDPNSVNAIIAEDGTGLYFTRSMAPFSDVANDKYHIHIGIYGYDVNTLEKFTKLPQSYLEKRERLEQLRALENGIKIKVLTTDLEYPISVDVMADLEKARQTYYI